MATQNHSERIGGGTVYVSDCHLWATIRYLDSATDYRECLPFCGGSVEVPDNKLMMLEDRRQFSWTNWLVISTVGILVCGFCFSARAIFHEFSGSFLKLR
jgi:hypothetical protein